MQEKEVDPYIPILKQEVSEEEVDGYNPTFRVSMVLSRYVNQGRLV